MTFDKVCSLLFRTELDKVNLMVVYFLMFIFSLNENPRHPARHLSKVGVLHPFPVYVVQKYKKAMGRQKKWREKFLNLEEFINFAIEK